MPAASVRLAGTVSALAKGGAGRAALSGGVSGTARASWGACDRRPTAYLCSGPVRSAAGRCTRHPAAVHPSRCDSWPESSAPRLTVTQRTHTHAHAHTWPMHPRADSRRAQCAVAMPPQRCDERCARAAPRERLTCAAVRLSLSSWAFRGACASPLSSVLIASSSLRSCRSVLALRAYPCTNVIFRKHSS